MYKIKLAKTTTIKHNRSNSEMRIENYRLIQNTVYDKLAYEKMC